MEKQVGFTAAMRRRRFAFLSFFLLFCVALTAQGQIERKSYWATPKKMSSNMAPYGWQGRMRNVASPIEKKFHQNGPATAECLQIELREKSIKKLTVWFPKGMRTASKRYPLVVLANGTGVPATAYASVNSGSHSPPFRLHQDPRRQPHGEQAVSRRMVLLLAQRRQRRGQSLLWRQSRNENQQQVERL